MHETLHDGWTLARRVTRMFEARNAVSGFYHEFGPDTHVQLHCDPFLPSIHASDRLRVYDVLRWKTSALRSEVYC